MLSWHEGFGLTGWEAVAGEVPLIIGRDTGLHQLLTETFGESFVNAYVRTIDVRGQISDTANFLPEDERDVCNAIIECTANLENARKAAAKLKRELKEKWVCTWENTAKQFLVGLGTQPPRDNYHRYPIAPDMYFGSRGETPQENFVEILVTELNEKNNQIAKLRDENRPLNNQIEGSMPYLQWLSLL